MPPPVKPAGPSTVDDGGLEEGSAPGEGAAADDTVIPGPGEETGEEGSDGTQDGSDEENNDALNESGDDADADGGAGDSAPGEGGGEEEETPGTTAGKPDRLSRIEAALEKIANAGAAPQKKTLTEENWKTLEAEWGMPRKAIAQVMNAQRMGNQMVIDQMQELVSELRVDKEIERISRIPGFTDAKRYRKEIDEFLADIEPKYHSNEKILKTAIYVARGKNAGTDRQRQLRTRDRNVRIAGVARPASGVPARAAVAPTAGLNAMQRQAAALMGGEKEYKRFQRKGPGRSGIAIER